MALQSSGSISLNDIQTEFGGSNPINLNSEYASYAGISSGATTAISDFYGLSAVTAGSNEYISSGTYTFTVPAGVTSVCMLCIGGGGQGGRSGSNTGARGGGGGGLLWRNNVSVTPGESLTVVVGAGGYNT